jgi:hypothetical protein
MLHEVFFVETLIYGLFLEAQKKFLVLKLNVCTLHLSYIK